MFERLLAAILAALIVCTGLRATGGEATGDPAPADPIAGQRDPGAAGGEVPPEETPAEAARRKALEAEIAGLIKDLGHAKWDNREAAQKRLLAIGLQAASALRAAAASEDLEVATRARAILIKVVGQGWLGVEIRDPDEDDRGGRDYPQEGGTVVVAVLPNTPAEKAKLVAGDLLYSIDGRVLKNTQDLIELVAATEPGTGVKLVVYSNNRKKEVDLTIGRRPAEYVRE